MNNRSKRVMKELEALGCYRDYDAISGAPVNYRHPNDPEQLFKVSDAMTDSARTFVIKRAKKVAGLGTSGSVKPQTIKERARIMRQEQKAHRQREAEERRKRAEQKEAQWAAREAKRAAREARQAEVDAAESELVDVDEAIAHTRQTLNRIGQWKAERVPVAQRLESLLRRRDDLLGVIDRPHWDAS